MWGTSSTAQAEFARRCWCTWRRLSSDLRRNGSHKQEARPQTRTLPDHDYCRAGSSEVLLRAAGAPHYRMQKKGLPYFCNHSENCPSAGRVHHAASFQHAIRRVAESRRTLLSSDGAADLHGPRAPFPIARGPQAGLLTDKRQPTLQRVVL